MLGPVSLHLALRRLDAGAQLVEPPRQLVGGAAGGAGLDLAIGVEEDVGDGVGDERRLLRVRGGRGDHHDEGLAATLHRQAARQVAQRQLAPGFRLTRAGTRQDGAQQGDRVEVERGRLAVEFGVAGEVQLVDHLVEDRTRGQDPHLVLDDRQRGVGRKAGLGQVAVDHLQVARVDQKLAVGLVLLRDGKGDADADGRAEQRQQEDEQPGAGDAPGHRDRIDERSPGAVVRIRRRDVGACLGLDRLRRGERAGGSARRGQRSRNDQPASVGATGGVEGTTGGSGGTAGCGLGRRGASAETFRTGAGLGAAAGSARGKGAGFSARAKASSEPACLRPWSVRSPIFLLPRLLAARRTLGRLRNH